MQKTFAKFIQCGLILSCLAVLGCKNPEQRFESEQAVVPPTQSVSTPSPQIGENRHEVRAPLNCPLMLVSRSYFSKHDMKQYLSFSLRDNPNFDPKVGDVCQGDIKNIWPDLMRFDAEIETHMPNIRWIGFTLSAFPITELDLKAFIDAAAKADHLSDRLNEIDRANLEGGMEYNREILSLIRTQENAYWLQKQAPVIEGALSKYDLKIKNFSGEKYAYCYHPQSYCRGYLSPKGTKPENRIRNEGKFELESFGPAFGGLTFADSR